MGVAIEVVDPRALAAEAAEVLRGAWPLPRLRYAPEDLAWQFRRPGWGDPRGWVGRDEAGRPVAFGAAMPRTVWAAGRPHQVLLTSFYAGLPGVHGAALMLLRTEVRWLVGSGRPTVLFAAQGSGGEAVLKCNDAAGYVRAPLGVARTYGGVAAAEPPAGLDAREASPADWPDILAVVESARVGHRVADDVTPASLAHDLEDPRGRCWAVVRDPGGAAVAAACVGLTEAVTPDGPSRPATLWSVALTPGAGPDALTVLVAFAARRWAGRTTTPVVTLPNPAGVPPEALRAARLRAMPVAWAGYAFSRDPADPLLTATETGLEII